MHPVVPVTGRPVYIYRGHRFFIFGDQQKFRFPPQPHKVFKPYNKLHIAVLAFFLQIHKYRLPYRKQFSESVIEEAAEENINLKGKIGAAFGSYGWSGEAPKLLLEIMKKRFEMQVVDPPLLTKYAPDKKALENCNELGKNVAETLMPALVELESAYSYHR